MSLGEIHYLDFSETKAQKVFNLQNLRCAGKSILNKKNKNNNDNKNKPKQ